MDVSRGGGRGGGVWTLYAHTHMDTTISKSVFEDKEIAAKLADIHDKYVVVPADKASNNVIFDCKRYYICSKCRFCGS